MVCYHVVHTKKTHLKYTSSEDYMMAWHEVLPLLGQLQAPVVQKMVAHSPCHITQGSCIRLAFWVSLGKRTVPFPWSILGIFSWNGGDGTDNV